MRYQRASVIPGSSVAIRLPPNAMVFGHGTTEVMVSEMSMSPIGTMSPSQIVHEFTQKSSRRGISVTRRRSGFGPDGSGEPGLGLLATIS
jgi:hypothetical protein